MEALISAPIMKAPDWSKPFELMCDASEFAIGAVLGQRHNKVFHTIDNVKLHRLFNPILFELFYFIYLFMSCYADISVFISGISNFGDLNKIGRK